jgi:hypothetical protein
LLLLIPLLAAAAVVVDRERDRDREAETAAAAAEVQAGLPVAVGASALTSTWYCAAGTSTGTGDAAAEHVVHVVNTASDPVTARVTAYPTEGASASQEVQLAPFGRADVRVSDIVQAPWASALVEADAGDIAVQHEVVGPLGRSLGACASEPSARWFFPSATTRPGARLVMALFNPFPSDAVVDIGFETDDGARTPQPYQGLVVPAERVVALEVSDVVTLRNEMATTVTVRSGRIVAEQLQISEGTAEQSDAAEDGSDGGADPDDDSDESDDTGDGEDESATGETTESSVPDETATDTGLPDELVDLPPGLALMLGAPATAETWMFPDGVGADAYDEQFVVFNPGTEPAEVEVLVLVDDPQFNGVAEPFQVSVPPGRYAVINTFADGRVPIGVSHSAFALVTNEVPVVVQRVVLGGEQSVQPGISYTLGSPVTATRWIAPAAALPGGSASAVILLNPSPSEPVTLSVRALTDGRYDIIEGLDGVGLAPAARRVIDLGPDGLGLDLLAVEIESSGPVVMESRIGFADNADLSYLISIPVAGTLVAPSRLVGEVSDQTVILGGG